MTTAVTWADVRDADVAPVSVTSGPPVVRVWRRNSVSAYSAPPILPFRPFPSLITLLFGNSSIRFNSLRNRNYLPGPAGLEDGAMSIFTTRDAAEEFVRGDPFVLHGVVRNWTIREWNEALVPDK